MPRSTHNFIMLDFTERIVTLRHCRSSVCIAITSAYVDKAGAVATSHGRAVKIVIIHLNARLWSGIGSCLCHNSTSTGKIKTVDFDIGSININNACDRRLRGARLRPRTIGIGTKHFQARCCERTSGICARSYIDCRISFWRRGLKSIQ